MAKQTKQIEQAYRLAKERYAALGVDTDKALKHLNTIIASLRQDPAQTPV